MLPLRREQAIYGRCLYATGGNAEAARLAGVRIRPLRLAAFGLSGVGAERRG
jgi:ribose transport system permease protein